MNIVVRTLSDRVFEIVREQIVRGTLPASAPIRQDALASELGVSKIPLREALARLEQEGLIASQANRGYTVLPMTAAQAEEIYELRLAIEPAAAAHGARNAKDCDRAATRAAYDRLTVAKAQDLAEVAVCNREFHTAMVRPGARALTTALVQRLSVLSERYVIAHLQPAGREHRAHVEHRTLLDAWMIGDGMAVQAMMERHLAGTIEDLRVQFLAGTS